MKHTTTAALAAAAAFAASSACAAPVLMTPEWAAEACRAWNADPVLTEGLVEKWVRNDNGRGFKVMQVYRTDCKDSPRVELRIALKDNKAMCTYGGAVETKDLSRGHDYIMHAETRRWIEMGKGEYGPMRAMMFGRLEFEGPKMEAMNNMGPFENFLLLVGKVPGETSVCPK